MTVQIRFKSKLLERLHQYMENNELKNRSKLIKQLIEKELTAKGY